MYKFFIKFYFNILLIFFLLEYQGTLIDLHRFLNRDSPDMHLGPPPIATPTFDRMFFIARTNGYSNFEALKNYPNF